jgi:hypothetical protein
MDDASASATLFSASTFETPAAQAPRDGGMKPVMTQPE